MATRNLTDKTQFPRQGNNEDLFQRLSEYISFFDKSWVNRIKPASQESIERLKQVSEFDKWNKEFPKEYHIFLEHMGNDDGGLLSETLMGKTAIEKIIEVCEDEKEVDLDPFNSPYFLFFNDYLARELSFDLNKDTKYSIVNQSLKVEAETFEKLLFQCAFRRFELYNNWVFAFQNQNERNPNLFCAIDGITKKYNMQKAWFSDEQNYIALGENYGFCIINIDAKESITGSVTGNNQEIVNELCNTFSTELNFKLNYKDKPNYYRSYV